MAIPTWLWQGDEGGASRTGTTERDLSAADIERVTAALDVLSDETRREILTVLYGRTEPISYSALQEAVDVRDNGRLNYHLRQLDDLLTVADGTYALNDYGETVLQSVLAQERRLRP
ncbi:helix-turn-helix domain-containing protein [Haloarculaceae archaeon H-GB2-1]|nr:helix-turn-helix domain-containing protein [Haloarculaceae archaeon H-GB1-1]MEA5406731.1 helix-turn-helix domain-containing protein [Haloarculaceae archaeon H-GB2-1]